MNWPHPSIADGCASILVGLALLKLGAFFPVDETSAIALPDPLVALWVLSVIGAWVFGLGVLTWWAKALWIDHPAPKDRTSR